MIKPIQKMAVANRGEVAVRILQACQELGIKSVLLHSEADQSTRAYRLADETICIGPSAVNESYLNIDNNIHGIIASGADAVHPGFGFLSENAEFAQACEDNKITFIGPKPETIRDLGDKIKAKEIVAQDNIPTIPGYKGDKQDIETLLKECETIGYPVLVKAAAGGGGRGMKVIRHKDEAEEQIASAQREGKSAFGSSQVFLEKYLENAKHIEVQVFGDIAGRAVHLYERECSLQRRHQKVIEESPSANLTKDMREKVTTASVNLAQRVGYIGAGTVEFLVEGDQYYFLEMNTRLQVEHPVTEMVLGVDLVKAQILNMSGLFSLWPQESLKPRGHAIECRLYAEDPFTVGLPSTGQIAFQQFQPGSGRRFDYGFEGGDEITPFYDSMIAKVIVWDETRPRAIMKMIRCLQETVVFGVKTNIPFLLDLLRHEEFIEGSFSTQLIAKDFPEGARPRTVSPEKKELLEKAYKEVSSHAGAVSSSTGSSLPSPLDEGWRNT